MTSLQALRRCALPAALPLVTTGFGDARVHAAGANNPAITVTPGTGLTDGQHVQVSGTGYQKQQHIIITECGGGDMNAKPIVRPVCSDYTVTVETDAQGAFAAQDFVVHTSYSGHRYSRGIHTEAATHTCTGAKDCYIYAYAKDRATRFAREYISFAP
jgi:hypothetical protein